MTIDKIKETLCSILEVDADRIDENTNIIEDLGADSLDVVEIMTSLEEEFDVTLSDEDIHSVKTVGDILSVIEARGI